MPLDVSSHSRDFPQPRYRHPIITMGRDRQERLRETKAPCSFTRPSSWSLNSPGGDPSYLTCLDSVCLSVEMCPPLHRLWVLVGRPIIESHPLPGHRQDQAQHLTHLTSVIGPGKGLKHSQPIRALPWDFLPGFGEQQSLSSWDMRH